MTHIINQISKMQSECLKIKQLGSLGFVPTMGYLHKGHLSLIEKSKKKAQFTLVSIFVNPKQFGKNEDLESYPRSFERDYRLCKDLGVDIIFAPKEIEMYPKGFSSLVQEKRLSKKLCGLSRPQHFEGVCTIICKLLNITQADYLFLGEKDFQQLKIVDRLVKDLNIPIKIIPCSTIREKNGLAMSSRNKYLNTKQKEKAASVYQFLEKGKASFLKEKTYEEVKTKIKKELSKLEIKEDYIEICDEHNLKSLHGEIDFNKKTRVFIGFFIEGVRLIDNLQII